MEGDFWHQLLVPTHTCTNMYMGVHNTHVLTNTHKCIHGACTEVTWRWSEALWLVQCWAPVSTHHMWWVRGRRDQGQAGQEGAG